VSVDGIDDDEGRQVPALDRPPLTLPGAVTFHIAIMAQISGLEPS